MELELDKYFKAVLRWWWLIIISTILAAVASYFASQQQPRVYQTTATLLVGQVIQQANPSGSDFSTTEQLAESYAQIAVRQPILQATVESLGLDMSWRDLKARVNATPIARTQLLAITVEDNSPGWAVALANEIADQLILQSPTSPEKEAREERSRFVQSELNDLETKIEAARTRISELEIELEEALSARQIQDLQNEITNLDALIRGWQRNYTDLLDFFNGSDSSNFLTVIEPAQLPNRPVSPIIVVNVAVAALAGLVLAVVAALLLEYVDDTIKSSDDLSASFGLTPLGGVNRIKGKDYKGKLITSHSPFSSLAEAYREIRTNIQFTSIDQPAKSILVTSPNPGEGKSITVANLGVTMARAFHKTVIIDTDLRKPSMHHIFGVSNQTGITDLIYSPELELDEYIRETGIENLQLITSGPLPPNPSEMLGSQRMVKLLQRLQATADVIIFDSPPVMAATDATVLSRQLDGVILVIQAKRTRKNAIRQSIRRLEQVGANFIGGVVNQVSGKSTYHQTYSAYTHSGQQQTAAPLNQGPRRRWWQRSNVSN